MEYIIFVAICLTILTIYHIYKYNSSNYSEFEHYLDEETWPIVGSVVVSTLYGVVFLSIIAIGYAGGQFIKLFM